MSTRVSPCNKYFYGMAHVKASRLGSGSSEFEGCGKPQAIRGRLPATGSILCQGPVSGTCVSAKIHALTGYATHDRSHKRLYMLLTTSDTCIPYRTFSFEAKIETCNSPSDQIRQNDLATIRPMYMVQNYAVPLRDVNGLYLRGESTHG